MVATIERPEEQRTQRMGTLIQGFRSDDDRDLYMQMLHQPENLLKGEKIFPKISLKSLSFEKLKNQQSLQGLKSVPAAQESLAPLLNEAGLPGEDKEKIDLLIDSAFDLTAPKIEIEKRFGIFLVKKEIISEENLSIALMLQKKAGYKIGKVLLVMGVLTEECLAKALAQYFDLPYKKLVPEDLDESLVKDLPEKRVFTEAVLPFCKEDGKIWVACSDPLSLGCLKEIKKRYGMDIQVFVCSNSVIIKAFLKV